PHSGRVRRALEIGCGTGLFVARAAAFRRRRCGDRSIIVDAQCGAAHQLSGLRRRPRLSTPATGRSFQSDRDRMRVSLVRARPAAPGDRSRVVAGGWLAIYDTEFVGRADATLTT